MELKESLKERKEIIDFKESLTREEAFRFCKEKIGLKLYSFKEISLSEHFNSFVLNIIIFESYLKTHYPSYFNKKGYCLKRIIGDIYCSKTAVCIEKLL